MVRPRHGIVPRLTLFVALVVATAAQSAADAATLAGFETDAHHVAPADALYSQTARDWAESASSSGEGVFLLSPGSSCYGSALKPNPAIGGFATFICDGSSDARFDGQGNDAVTEPEMSTVSPGGKQIQDVWTVQPGGVTGKDDFSHAYSLFRKADSPCDSDALADDPFLALGGHRGDNEGDAFWGFELDQKAPAAFSKLVSNGGSNFSLNFNRTKGDLLVSFTLVGGGTNPLLEVFSWNGATFVLAASLCPGGSQGNSLLRTNATGDIKAPPWNVPVCDPTATNSANSCRIVNGAGTAPAQSGDTRLAPRDFNEAVVDLSAFVAPGVCFDSLIFTSRSAHPLETADLKDIGGANVDTCPVPAAPPAPPPAPQNPTPPPATPAPPQPDTPSTPSCPPPTDPNQPFCFPPTGGRPRSHSDWRWLAGIGGLVVVLALPVELRDRRIQWRRARR